MVLAYFDTIPGWSGSNQTTTTVTSMTVDITGATVGEIVYAWISLRNSQTSITFTGWTQIDAMRTIAATGAWALFKRTKVSGDTTFTLSWSANSTQGFVLLQQWPGAVADEGGSVTTRTSAANVFTTPGGTPTDGNRRAVGFYCAVDGDSTHKTVTWTPSGDMTNTIQTGANTNGTLAWDNCAIVDSGGPVSIASHSGTETTSGTSTINNGATAILFLIPPSIFQPAPMLQAVNRAAVI
jgi:hypothetical protein